jgi:hypothetical protein
VGSGAAVFVLAVLAAAVPAWAGQRALFDRHGVRERPALKPSGVPSSYVSTRHGFFHPSCVVKLRSDESIDNDGVIRDLAGGVRERVAPCTFPRFMDASTVPAPPAEPSPTAALARPRHAYDGWLTWYQFQGACRSRHGHQADHRLAGPHGPGHRDQAGHLLLQQHRHR